jgi:hypothetical protein
MKRGAHYARFRVSVALELSIFVTIALYATAFAQTAKSVWIDASRPPF